MSSFLSTVLMNIENNLAASSPLLFFTAGVCAWFGVYWAYRAIHEPFYVRILAPIALGLAVMGFHSVLQILHILSIFVIKAMLHPIPFTIGLATIGVARSVTYIKDKVREEVEAAFQHLPAAVAAAQEQEEEAEANHEQEGNLNDAFVQDDDNTDADDNDENDNETIVGDGEQQIHQVQPPALPISPPSSPNPLQITSYTNLNELNVVEPFELIHPYGGAGDVMNHY